MTWSVPLDEESGACSVDWGSRQGSGVKPERVARRIGLLSPAGWYRDKSYPASSGPFPHARLGPPNALSPALLFSGSRSQPSEGPRCFKGTQNCRGWKGGDKAMPLNASIMR
jgi:hypothetical protein